VYTTLLRTTHDRCGAVLSMCCALDSRLSVIVELPSMLSNRSTRLHRNGPSIYSAFILFIFYTGKREMFKRAADMSFNTRIGISIIVATIVTTYCYITTTRAMEEREARQASAAQPPRPGHSSPSVWWICGRLFTVSIVAVYLISGLFGNQTASGGTTSEVNTLRHALTHIDPGPPKF
jgi:hypothetical protein